MSCGLVKGVHIKPSDCEPEGDIRSIHYSPDDIDYLLGPDANNLSDDIVITDIVTDTGEGFYILAAAKEGEQLPTLTLAKESDDNGVSTRTQEYIQRIPQDTPEVRAFCEKYHKKKVDLLFTYNGEYDYPAEISQTMKLMKFEFSSTTRAWTLTWRAMNPEEKSRLVFKTDRATTLSLIDSLIVA